MQNKQSRIAEAGSNALKTVAMTNQASFRSKEDAGMAVDQTEGSWTREQLLAIGFVAVPATGVGWKEEEVIPGDLPV